MPSAVSIMFGIKVVVILQLAFLLILLLLFPDGTFGQTSNANSTADTTTPTCQKLVEDEKFYFPNDCVSKCSENGNEFDTGRSRNLNGKMKCYCIGDTIPICNDDPLCSDLSVRPGTAYDDCLNNVCSGNTVDGGVAITDEIEYADDPDAYNKNQTHFKVSCSCDGGETYRCGIDSILFSDMSYLPSCTVDFDSTPNKVNNLNINSQDECMSYCTTEQNNVFLEGEWMIYESNPPKFSCVCIDKNFDGSAIACDDTRANYNDGSESGAEYCYDEVGVNVIDCPETTTTSDPPPSSAGTTNYSQKNLNWIMFQASFVAMFMFIFMWYRGVL